MLFLICLSWVMSALGKIFPDTRGLISGLLFVLKASLGWCSHLDPCVGGRGLLDATSRKLVLCLSWRVPRPRRQTITEVMMSISRLTNEMVGKGGGSVAPARLPLRSLCIIGQLFPLSAAPRVALDYKLDYGFDAGSASDEGVVAFPRDGIGVADISH